MRTNFVPSAADSLASAALQGPAESLGCGNLHSRRYCSGFACVCQSSYLRYQRYDRRRA